MIHSAVTVYALCGPSFLCRYTASDAPLIVFAIKEHSKLISILEKREREKKHDDEVVQISH